MIMLAIDPFVAYCVRLYWEGIGTAFILGVITGSALFVLIGKSWTLFE